jgi:RNA polymerase sigma-70 factor (ECF subfamily)
VQQELRARLLVDDPARPAKLRDYVGRGRLASWLRVVAVRVALDRHRSQRPVAELDDAMAISADPELGYLEARYRQQFQDAFRTALGELEPRERTVLRMHLVDGLAIDRIGVIYDVHRATAARWLSSARDNLYEMTRAHLRAELGLNDDEFASIVRLVRSRLDISVMRLLEESGEPDERARSQAGEDL